MPSASAAGGVSSVLPVTANSSGGVGSSATSLQFFVPGVAYHLMWRSTPAKMRALYREEWAEEYGAKLRAGASAGGYGKEVQRDGAVADAGTPAGGGTSRRSLQRLQQAVSGATREDAAAGAAEQPAAAEARLRLLVAADEADELEERYGTAGVPGAATTSAGGTAAAAAAAEAAGVLQEVRAAHQRLFGLDYSTSGSTVSGRGRADRADQGMTDVVLAEVGAAERGVGSGGPLAYFMAATLSSTCVSDHSARTMAAAMAVALADAQHDPQSAAGRMR
jgi:hypothetical protein